MARPSPLYVAGSPNRQRTAAKERHKSTSDMDSLFHFYPFSTLWRSPRTGARPERNFLAGHTITNLNICTLDDQLASDK